MLEASPLRKLLGCSDGQAHQQPSPVEPKARRRYDIYHILQALYVRGCARRTGERISFHYLISQKYTGDRVRLDVLREGATAELDVRLASPDALVPLHLGGLGPSFLIVAGAPAAHAHPLCGASPHMHLLTY